MLCSFKIELDLKEGLKEAENDGREDQDLSQQLKRRRRAQCATNNKATKEQTTQLLLPRQPTNNTDKRNYSSNRFSHCLLQQASKVLTYVTSKRINAYPVRGKANEEDEN